MIKGFQKMQKKIYFVVAILGIIYFILGSVQILKKEDVSITYHAEEIFADTAEGRVYDNKLCPETAENMQMLRTEELYLEKGIYQISVKYSSTDGGNVSVAGDGKGPKSIWAESAWLSANYNEKSYSIWANDPLERFRVQVTSLGGTLSVESVEISTAENSKLYQCTCLFLKLALVNLLIGLYCYRDKLRKYSIEIVGLAGIAFIASVAMLTRYMLPGHDLVFHLLRIEGLKDGLLSGVFPVRIQPNWCNGWGYAVSVMYGDTSLYLPAMMRMAGFTVQTSYKTFVIAVNIVTACVAFYSFKKICGDKYIALLGSLMYTTAPYRLCCIYIRGAFGEYTAMIFLPLIALGFWYAFCENTDEKDYGKKYLAPVIGFSGLIQTHILTCQMVGLFVVLLCVLCIRKVFRRKTFIYLAKIVVLTILLNLWFLLPFIVFFGEDLICTQFREMAADYQMLGVSLAELFAQEASNYYGYSWSELTSLKNKFSIPLGNGLLLSGVLALLVLWKRKISDKTIGKVVFGLSVLSVWMATNLFPYHEIQIRFPKLAAFLAKPGLPYRYLSMACLLLSLLAVIVFWKTKGYMKESIALAAFLVIGGLAVYQGMAFSYQTLYNGYYEVHYDGGLLNSTHLMGNEYLYQGSETWITEVERSVSGENVSVIAEERNYNHINVVCENALSKAYLHVPLFYYPGYVAYDVNEPKQEFQLVRGGNNRISVVLPEGYSGEVAVTYREPISWRVAEIISIFGMIGIIIFECMRKQRKYPKGKEDDGIEKDIA